MPVLQHSLLDIYMYIYKIVNFHIQCIYTCIQTIFIIHIQCISILDIAVSKVSPRPPIIRTLSPKD